MLGPIGLAILNLRECYARVRLELWVPQGGRVFVDVGANVGTWTRWLAPRFQHVHAIEPNPDALPILRATLPHNATVHDIGAWHCETISDVLSICTLGSTCPVSLKRRESILDQRWDGRFALSHDRFVGYRWNCGLFEM